MLHSHRLRLVTVIGDKREREQREICFGVPTLEAEFSSVCLRLQQQRNLLVSDCETHLQAMHRLLDGPRPEHY